MTDRDELAAAQEREAASMRAQELQRLPFRELVNMAHEGNTDAALALPAAAKAYLALAAHRPDARPHFTWEHVDVLRGEDGGWVSVDDTRPIADLIAALLPPREARP